WAPVAVTVTGLRPESLSAGVPEMTPVAALMLKPAGRAAANVRVSPAAGAAKWLETSSENAWPSLALWLAMGVPVGPVSPTVRATLSETVLPWATVAGTVIGLLSSWSLKVRAPETAPVGISVVWPSGGLACEVGALAAD